MALNEQQLGDLGVSIHAGFPNAAIGSHAQSLDLNKLLIPHPATTFFMRLDGDWPQYELHAQDLLTIDRSTKPKPLDLVIWVDAEAFTLSPLRDVPLDTPIWGTVTTIIRTRQIHNERALSESS